MSKSFKADLSHVRIITVDYGGVLAHHYCEPYQSLLAKMLGVSVEESKRLISEKSEQGRLYRTNKISQSEFWAKIAKTASIDTSVDVNTLQLIWAKTYILDQRIFALLRTIRAVRQIKLGILSNTDFDRLFYIEETYGLSKYFDVEIYSCQTGFMKTDHESITKLMKDSGENLNPQNILIIDDREFAVQQAINAGLNAYLYTGYNDLVDFFRSSNILTDELLY